MRLGRLARAAAAGVGGRVKVRAGRARNRKWAHLDKRPELFKGNSMKAKITPPRHLSAEARQLWQRLQAEYGIDDSAGLALLRAAAEAFDRSQQARALIAQEGLMLPDRFGAPKPHPAVAIERDSRTQLLAALRALKLAPEVL
ncbi:MAG: P27 family phage terminase small subunit [Burkholderiales bacterium]|nr:P27 family phage terminase small subunit [Burkholderiales bacterium]